MALYIEIHIHTYLLPGNLVVLATYVCITNVLRLLRGKDNQVLKYGATMPGF